MVEARSALERRLALHRAHLRFGRRNQDAAPHGDLEIDAELAGQHRPHVDRAAHERQRRAEGARPAVALLDKRLVRDLRVQAAGIGPRGERIEVAPLEERHRYAVVGEVIGGCAAGQAAADHDHVGRRRGGQFHRRYLPQIVRYVNIRSHTEQNSVRHTLSIPTRELAPRIPTE